MYVPTAIHAALLSLWLLGPTEPPQQRWVLGLSIPYGMPSDLRKPTWDKITTDVVATANGRLVRRLPFAIVVDAPHASGKALLSHPQVAWLQLEQPITVQTRNNTPNDEHYPQQWYLHHTPSGWSEDASVDIQAAWLHTFGSNSAHGVIVAVLDDGFDLEHPDLAERFLLPGLDISSGVASDGAHAGPGDHHGTQTAGVIAATTFNEIGVAGVCPECQLLPIRLIGGGGPEDLYEIDSTAAAEALVWAVDMGAAVINNSWGPPDGNPFDPFGPTELFLIPTALDLALQYAARCGRLPIDGDCDQAPGLGTVVTWAAGNGAELATYDGFVSHPNVVGVGAVSAQGVHPYYSDWGPTVDLVAPSSGGVGEPKIWTTDRTGSAGIDAGDYSQVYGGTSASSAIVAGVAALVLARHPELTAAQVIESLLASAFPIDAQRAEYGALHDDGRSLLYGFGRVDPAAALEYAAAYLDTCTDSFELCGNGRDDNCNGIDDVDEPRCTSCLPDAPMELCDGRDNNCDGRIDEMFVCETSDRPICAPCTSSAHCTLDARCRGAAGFPGTWCFKVCDADGGCPSGFQCNGEVCVLAPTEETRDCLDLLRCNMPERCDGIDNDCNGIIDDLPADSLELLGVWEQCGNLGVCGEQPPLCVDGRWLCNRPNTWEAVETRCDGLDNDCNGIIDEGCEPPSRSPDCQGCGASPQISWFAVAAWALWWQRRRRL